MPPYPVPGAAVCHSGPVLLTLTAHADDALDDARDLGHLLHKHPDRVQQADLPVGTAHVLYPVATAQECTVALVLEVDPVDLVRGRRFHSAFTLGEYVNDRPYAASSLLAVALRGVFSTALAGTSRSHPELARTPLSLEIRVPVVPAREGVDLVARLFGPLGWQVEATPVPLDDALTGWGDSAYVDLRLTGRQRLADALSHLYVLLPVLDGSKHYWVGTAEVDKLLRHASSWLTTHPDREFITERYLGHRRDQVADATDRLASLDDTAPAAVPAAPTTPLKQIRVETVVGVLVENQVATVVDLGCGEGRLIRELSADNRFTSILGTDVSAAAVERAERALHLDELSDRERDRIALVQSSVTYRDDRVAGRDAAVLMEVVEHLDPDRLPDAARAVFGHARPGLVVVTTPNADFNARYPDLAPGAMRHPDHRFEWTRAEFAHWAEEVTGAYGYTVEYRDVGEPDPDLGPPTQLALFRRRTEEA